MKTRIYAAPAVKGLILLLTLEALKYVCINHENQRGFQFEIIIDVLVSFFRFI